MLSYLPITTQDAALISTLSIKFVLDHLKTIVELYVHHMRFSRRGGYSKWGWGSF